MLVTIVGPGVLAGIIAIGLRSIGFCAKLLYEAIEEIDESQVEAVTATGASRAQTLAYGIAPQIMPAFAGISVFRWDINIRERSEEHTSELQSLMRISYAVFCLKKKK